MKIIVEQEPIFTLRIGKKVFSNMRKISAWEGFTKLQSSDAMAIVFDERGHITRTLDDAFNLKKPQEFTVILGSENLNQALKDYANEAVIPNDSPQPGAQVLTPQ